MKINQNLDRTKWLSYIPTSNSPQRRSTLLWVTVSLRAHQGHSGSSKDEMKSCKSTRADELAQPDLSWPASTSLIVMVTIGSRSASDMACRHQFLFSYCYFEIIAYPSLLNHVMYLLLIYLNLSTEIIVWTLLFEPMHCDNSYWLISLPFLICWSSECSDVQVQASLFQLFLMFLSVSKYLNT